MRGIKITNTCEAGRKGNEFIRLIAVLAIFDENGFSIMVALDDMMRCMGIMNLAVCGTVISYGIEAYEGFYIEK